MKSEEARYKNPWHQPNDKAYGPEFYTPDSEPEEYNGYLIYNRWDRFGDVWDVVKDEVCVTCMAGPNGARKFIDELIMQTADDASSLKM